MLSVNKLNAVILIVVAPNAYVIPPKLMLTFLVFISSMHPGVVLLVDVGPTTCAPITVSLHPSALSPLPTPAQCAAMYSNGQHQKDESKDSKLLTLAKKFNRFFFNGKSKIPVKLQDTRAT
jgi:hypothetical protein